MRKKHIKEIIIITVGFSNDAHNDIVCISYADFC